jgi:hypothetical protein
VSRITRRRTHRCLSVPYRVCADFLGGFKAARRAARAANSARSPQLPLALPLRRRQRRLAGVKAKNRWGRIQLRKAIGKGAAGFDKGTLAMAQIELMRAGQKQPDSRDSVRAIAPCQIPPLRPSIALPYHVSTGQPVDTYCKRQRHQILVSGGVHFRTPV